MAGITAPVEDGQLQISESSQKKERQVGSQLGKEDFLMLLVAQMKYQDPLSPTDNTEYVAQLAQFTELEYMQNMSDTTTNTSAFSLVGKTVYIQSASETGNVTEVEGVVDYVIMKSGEPYVCVNGVEYAYDDVVQVLDDVYVAMQKVPSVEPQDHLFLHHDPQDLVITGIDMGEDEYQAYGMGVGLMDEDGNTVKLSSKYVTYKNGVLTIDKDALTWLDAGKYQVVIVFDDPYGTVSYGDVTLTVKGVATTQKPDDLEPPEDEGEGEDGEGGEGEDGSEDVGDVEGGGSDAGSEGEGGSGEEKVEEAGK